MKPAMTSLSRIESLRVFRFQRDETRSFPLETGRPWTRYGRLPRVRSRLICLPSRNTVKFTVSPGLVLLSK
jgi:hypothetical protein